MNDINEYSIAYSEVLEILKYIPTEDYNKVPEEKIRLFKSNADKEYIFDYNPEKTLDENNVSKRAKAIIAILFRDYWANDVQRKIIIAKQNNDRREMEEEKKKNYKYEDLFKYNDIKKKKSLKTDDNSINNAITKSKMGYFAKIINKIRKFLKME